MVMNDMTDDGKWGAAIRTDGQRPEWLSGRQTCQMYTGKIGHGGWCTWVDPTPIEPAEAWAWSHRSGEPNITQIRLLADHPHYQQTQTQTLTAQERLERLEAFAGRIARLDGIKAPETPPFSWVEEARALVAEMEPVVDGDLVEADRFLADAGWDDATENRVGNRKTVAEWIAWGIKRGRELARGDVA